MKQSERFNFYKTTETEEKVIKNKNKMHYMFLAIGASILIYAGYNFYKSPKDNIDENQITKQEISQDVQKIENERNYHFNQIKEINEQDYKVFLKYMKIHFNMYDSRINILNEAFSSSTKILNNRYITNNIKELNNSLTNYKKEMETTIQDLDDVYKKVNGNMAEMITTQNYKLFLKLYSNYKSGILFVNVNMEKQLSNSFTANLEHNIEMKVDKKLEEIQKELTESVNLKDQIPSKKAKIK